MASCSHLQITLWERPCGGLGRTGICTNLQCPLVSRIVQDTDCGSCQYADGLPPQMKDLTASTAGAGTELKHLLASWGVQVVTGCRCLERASEMDQKGTAWCRANIDTISQWLQEEANTRGWKVRTLAKFGAKYVITQAIERAEAKARP